MTFDQVFQVSDVQPTVTFPADTTVGPGQGYDLTVSDPQGGGRLFAIWRNHEIPISRTGSTTLPPSAFVEGTGDLEIWRCTDHPPNQGFIYPCAGDRDQQVPRGRPHGQLERLRRARRPSAPAPPR